MFLRMKRSRNKEETKENRGVIPLEISNPFRINEILRLIIKEHAPLEARIPGDANCYTTSLLDLFPDQHRIALDELKPSEGHTNFLARKELKLSCSLDGMVVDFETELKEKGDAEGITFYRVLFPASINYLQRRLHPRVTVPGSADFQASYKNGKRRFNGYVHDLSASGIAVFLDGEQPIKEGDQLTDCVAKLPLIGAVKFDLEVSYAFNDPMRKIVKVGGPFTNIEPEVTEKLEALISQLQNM
jgi:c-di-GMP-binding flagellar brake protein YcgR